MHCITSFQQEAILGGGRGSSAIGSWVQGWRGSWNRKWSSSCRPGQGQWATYTTSGDQPLSPQRISASVTLTTLAMSFRERAEWNFHTAGSVMGMARQSCPQCLVHQTMQETLLSGWLRWSSPSGKTSASNLVGKGRPRSCRLLDPGSAVLRWLSSEATPPFYKLPKAFHCSAMPFPLLSKLLLL